METDREKHGLKGSVKSVLVETLKFEEQDGQVTEKPWFSHALIFNEEGLLTEETNRGPDGSESRTVSEYSDSHKLLTTKIYEHSGALVRDTKYIYDDEDRLVAEQLITPDGTVTTPFTYAYEVGGVKTKIQELDFAEDANLMIGIDETMTMIQAHQAKRIETRHDDHDKVVEVKVFNTTGSIVSRIEMRRDAQGKPLEEIQYNGDVVPFGTCASGSCSTEEMESLTEEQKAEFAAAIAQMFAPGTVMSRRTFQYDVEGRLIESNLTMMGMEIGRQTFAYDAAGNKSEEVNYNAEGSLAGKAIFTRDYDEHGNWTKELLSTASSWDAEFKLSTPTQLTRRTITYYT